MHDDSYNIEEALEFIFDKLEKDYKQISAVELKTFIQKAAELDDGYMTEMGFFEDEDTQAEKGLIYDEEDAYNYILDDLSKKPEYRKWKDDLLEDLIDEYIERKYDFLVSKDLVNWYFNTVSSLFDKTLAGYR